MALKNFSIILPGGCNAKCDFCDDPGQVQAGENYLEKLQEALDNMPDGYESVTVTGGETSISKYLKSVLFMLNKTEHVKKIVLNTNGTALLRKPWVFKYINHLNLSRHSDADWKNFQVFGTTAVPTLFDLSDICKLAHSEGVDVTINHVHTKENGIMPHQLIRMASLYSRIGCDGLALRYDNREADLNPTDLELFVKGKYEHLWGSGCPVCRSACYSVLDFPVTFKHSRAEPSEVYVDEIYEMVFHEDGNLYEDWSMKKPIKSSTSKKERTITLTEKELDMLLDKARNEGTKRANNAPNWGTSCGRSTGC